MLYEKLDYVIAIAEEANLTRAAKRLYISQPTLTMYLNRLEESLGVTLFDRRKNPVRLTEAGAYYIKKMKEISDSEQLLKNELRSIAHPSESFAIGIGRVRGHHWLPPLLSTLINRYPNIHFRAVQDSEKNLLSQFHSLNLDILIGSFSDAVIHSGTTKKLQISRRLLSRESMLFVAHKNYKLVPEEMRNTVTPRFPYLIEPERLNGLPFIASSPNTGMYSTFDMVMNLNHINPGRILYIDNQSTGLSLVAESLGIQLVSSSILSTLEKHYDPMDLDYLLIKNMSTTRSCYILWDTATEKYPLIQSTDRILRNEILIHTPFNEIISEDTETEEL
ncbi:MAG: LysR family transcriptional regulator [Oribacterium sp.]|nr:LysR family transcriptional regulator [Oribacterium sp.]